MTTKIIHVNYNKQFIFIPYKNLSLQINLQKGKKIQIKGKV